jgi:hypothetical protein
MLSVAGGSNSPKDYGLERQSELGNNNSDANSCLEIYLCWAVVDACCAVINTAPSGNHLLFAVKL